jgi:hypothetical protein
MARLENPGTNSSANGHASLRRFDDVFLPVEIYFATPVRTTVEEEMIIIL